MTRRRLLAAPFAPIAALLLAACAQNAPSRAPAATAADAAAPSSADRPRDDLEGQLAALGAAEAQLDRAMGRPPAGDSKKKEEREVEHPPTSKAAQSEAPKAYRAGSDDLGGADPCALACSALGSMERAVRHLCDLTGDGDAQCDNARSRVARATERVSASCPVCAAAP
jgi:hypothetical protein